MFTVIGWIFYVIIVSFVVKLFYTGDNGDIPIYVAAIAGSFVGGFFNWILGYSETMFAASGVIMGIIGTLVFLYGYDWLKPRLFK
jgi:uncharacterized membrane protein YeaQ/YmgE (transglycosylase-associated protein family)